MNWQKEQHILYITGLVTAVFLLLWGIIVVAFFSLPYLQSSKALQFVALPVRDMLFYMTPSTENRQQPEILVQQDKLADLPQPTSAPLSYKEITGEVELIPGSDTDTLASGFLDSEYGPLPTGVNLDIPFFSQAPDGIWTLPRKEACEEASITLAAYFIQGRSPDKETFKQDIRNLVDLQNTLFGDYIDTNLTQTAQLLEEYYAMSGSFIIDMPTVDDIKYWLSQGYPIVAPFAGRELGNTHFTDGGPRYHMLVIRGYDEEYFYTNDVGTMHGRNFPYRHEVIIDAMHDLTDDSILNGVKRILVVIDEQE